MSELGTAAPSRILAKRFQVVDPAAIGNLDSTISAVFRMGSEGDLIGIGVRSVVCVWFAAVSVPNVSAAFIDVPASSQFEYVLREVRVSSNLGIAQQMFLYVVRAGTFPLPQASAFYNEGGDPQPVSTQNLMAGAGNTAVVPPSGLVNRFDVVAGAGNKDRLQIPGGIVLRPGGGVLITGSLINQAFNGVFDLTERPISA